MKEDIEFKRVKEVAIAIAPEENEAGETEWRAYLLNLKREPILGVIVNSRGYGEVDGKRVKTSVLRHFFEKIEARDYVVIELVPEPLHKLSNEFWISFWYHDFMYDKKYVFVTESIKRENFTHIPLLDRKGVLIY